MKHFEWVSALLVGAVMFSCGDDIQDHNHYNLLHNCEIFSYNSAWSGMGLELYHDDNRSCPQNVTPGVSTVESGGIVDYPAATYPAVNPGGGNWPATLIVAAYNAYQTCETLGTEMDREQSDFVFYDLIGGSPNGNGPDGNNDWTGSAWVSFKAGTGLDVNRDCPTFQVIKGVQPSTNAVATMIVNYNQ